MCAKRTKREAGQEGAAKRRKEKLASRPSPNPAAKRDASEGSMERGVARLALCRHDSRRLVLRSAQIPNGVPEMDYGDVVQWSGGFSSDREAGRGAFGVVYRGSRNGMPVAIKRLRPTGTVRMKRLERSFEDELAVSQAVGHHEHVVRIIGKVRLRLTPLVLCSDRLLTCRPSRSARRRGPIESSSWSTPLSLPARSAPGSGGAEPATS